jgi:hypothetical protein
MKHFSWIVLVLCVTSGYAANRADSECSLDESFHDCVALKHLLTLKDKSSPFDRSPSEYFDDSSTTKSLEETKKEFIELGKKLEELKKSFREMRTHSREI